MTEAEKRVREAWEPGSKVPCGPSTTILLDNRYWIGPRRCEVDETYWEAADVFTSQRKKEIAEIDGAIALMTDLSGNLERIIAGGVVKRAWVNVDNLRDRVVDQCRAIRILALLQRERATLAKGMKGSK